MPVKGYLSAKSGSRIHEWYCIRARGRGEGEGGGGRRYFIARNARASLTPKRFTYALDGRPYVSLKLSSKSNFLIMTIN